MQEISPNRNAEFSANLFGVCMEMTRNPKTWNFGSGRFVWGTCFIHLFVWLSDSLLLLDIQIIISFFIFYDFLWYIFMMFMIFAIFFDIFLTLICHLVEIEHANIWERISLLSCKKCNICIGNLNGSYIIILKILSFRIS